MNNEKDEPLDRQRSRTNFAKKNITDNNKFDSKNIVRSQSWDTGKTYIESQSKEIDEMFEYLENFQSLHLNEKFFKKYNKSKFL